MQKLKIIFISLLVTVAFSSYADCPTVIAIQKSSISAVGGTILISDDKSKWHSTVNISKIKKDAVFFQAVVHSIEIEDELGKVRQFQDVSSVSCEYKSNVAGETKCENEACNFTLKPDKALKPNQCQIKKPTLDPQSPWKAEPHDTGGYGKVVTYVCHPGKNNSVSECPFSLEINM
jgi:hypothetical protein